jgi:serine/threonine protein kinase
MLLPAKQTAGAGGVGGGIYHDGTAVMSLDIPLSAVRILRRIGEGAFGTVYVGEVSSTFVTSNTVIVKTLSGGADIHTRSYFIERARAAIGLRHSNVLALVGACLQPGPSGTISTLYEHFDGIDLQTYLLHLHDEPQSDDACALLHIAGDVAGGMAYLAGCGWIHGDLAARNILVICHGAVVQAKVCDLALASPWYTATNSDNADLCLFSAGIADTGNALYPMGRAVAPEVLLYGPMAVCEASDVWSFGVLLWEMYNRRLSSTAQGTDNDDLAAVIVSLVSECCNELPSQRPTFRDVHRCLQALPRSATGNETDSVYGPQQNSGMMSTPAKLCSPPPPSSAAGNNTNSSPATSNDTAYTILTGGHLASIPTTGLSATGQRPSVTNDDNGGSTNPSVPVQFCSTINPTPSAVIRQHFANEQSNSNHCLGDMLHGCALDGNFVL